jgi:hypothetical protein
MRFKEHLSTIQIGKTLGVSRERVRQILEETGGSGGRDAYKPYLHTFDDDEWLREHAHLTNEELGKLAGIPTDSARVLRSRIPYRASGGAWEQKYIWTKNVAEHIEAHGLTAEMTPNNSPFGILVNDHLRVSVKSACSHRKYSPGAVTKHIRFLISKQREIVDFFVCVFYKDPTNPVYFVIPANEIRGKPHDIYIGWPPIHTPRSKPPQYADFKDRWDLLFAAAKSVV